MANRTIQIPLYSAAEMETLMRVWRLIAHMDEGTVPDEADRQWLQSILSAIAHNPRNPARENFGLPISRGRPADVGKILGVVAYVQLAMRYGHGKSEALRQAAEAFGFDTRTIERIVAGTPMQHRPESTPEAVLASLQGLVTAQDVPLPTRKEAMAPRLRRKSVRK